MWLGHMLDICFLSISQFDCYDFENSEIEIMRSVCVGFGITKQKKITFWFEKIGLSLILCIETLHIPIFDKFI